jgi:uncharacterized damage-inducible protein DinB
MPTSLDQSLLEAVLDSWDRNNRMMVNLLRALPAGALADRATPASPTVAELYAHIHYIRLVFTSEDAPEFGRDVPSEEWVNERDPEKIARWFEESAPVVREAVKGRIAAGRDMDRHYDHPILFLQHMLWHEGYHHGQIKVALKAAGHPLGDEQAGPVTWALLTRKNNAKV